MPIQQTQARLWFDTKEEEAAYDDKMISNIELKSLDFDDENFSPVFNRATKEVFLEHSDRSKRDFSRILQPFQSLTFEQLIDRYALIKPNHTSNRSWNFEKFFGGFGLSYIFLRELPLRNFYARVLVMSVLAAKLMDHLRSPFPFFGPQGSIVAAYDRWHAWELRCYDNVWRVLHFKEIPSIQNQVRESKKWYGRQPGHLLRSDLFYLPDYAKLLFTKRYREVPWDGTMNQPLHRLADPKHKDCKMIKFF